MSAQRHAEVRAPANEPCPFCGCGITLATHARRPARRRAPRWIERRPTVDELPEWWRPLARSAFTPHRQISPTEVATLAALDRIRGQAVKVDDEHADDADALHTIAISAIRAA